MERKWFQVAAGLTWLALPLTALHYWRAWDRLPPRMAVHFDANWQPNGWTSREGCLMLALIMTVGPLVIFSIASYVMSRRASVSVLSRWVMILVFYVALGFAYFVNSWIVDRNFDGHSSPFGELISPCGFQTCVPQNYVSQNYVPQTCVPQVGDGQNWPHAEFPELRS